MQNENKIMVFEEEKPNSQLNSRPLLIALADENDYFSLTSLTGPLFRERELLQNGVLTLHNKLGSQWNFTTKMYSTMYDEKLERKVAGIAGCSSKLLCTMCESTRQEAYDNPFGNTITRTEQQNQANLDRKLSNDTNTTYKMLLEESKGIASDCYFVMTPHIDALHCEINNALWFKSIFIREIADLNETKWTYGAKEKRETEQLKHAEELLNEKLRQRIGLQKHLMQPGNYSRLLLEDTTVKVIL